MGKPKKFVIYGTGYIEKTPAQHTITSSRIYLPASWAGKKVAVILLEE